MQSTSIIHLLTLYNNQAFLLIQVQKAVRQSRMIKKKKKADLLLNGQLARSTLEIKIVSVFFLVWHLQTRKELWVYNIQIKVIGHRRLTTQQLQQEKKKGGGSYHSFLKFSCSHSKVCQPSARIYLLLRWFSKRNPNSVTQTILHNRKHLLNAAQWYGFYMCLFLCVCDQPNHHHVNAICGELKDNWLQILYKKLEI